MSPKIYIIDDNFASQFATRIVLKQSQIPCEIVYFDQASLALSDFLNLLEKKQRLPDIILLDLNMPGMDGWEFLDEIGAIKYPREGTMIYLVSTFTNATDRTRSMEHPLLNGYFERPLSLENIQKILTVVS